MTDREDAPTWLPDPGIVNGYLAAVSGTEPYRELLEVAQSVQSLVHAEMSAGMTVALEALGTNVTAHSVATNALVSNLVHVMPDALSVIAAAASEYVEPARHAAELFLGSLADTTDFHNNLGALFAGGYPLAAALPLDLPAVVAALADAVEVAEEEEEAAATEHVVAVETPMGAADALAHFMAIYLFIDHVRSQDLKDSAINGSTALTILVALLLWDIWRRGQRGV